MVGPLKSVRAGVNCTDNLFLLYVFADSMTFNYSEGLQVSASYYGVFFLQVLVLIVNYALITPFILPP